MTDATKAPKPLEPHEPARLRWRIVLFGAIAGVMLVVLMASNPDGSRDPTDRELGELILFGAGFGAVIFGLPAMFLWRSLSRILLPSGDKPPKT